MISGVRASSIRIESTSSTIAKLNGRWTICVARIFHIVAQIVEAELVVGRVGDVALIGVAALLVGQVGDDHPDAQAEEAVDLPHPFGVALGEIVVDGDDMDALAGQRVEIDRERRDQRLALAGPHLGDLAAVERDAADHLDVVMALAERALGGLADRREGFGQQIVELGAVGEPLAEQDRSGCAARRRSARRWSARSR